MYCTASPCKECAIEMVNAGIKRLVFPKNGSYDAYAKIILLEGGVEIVIIVSVDLDERRIHG